MAVFRKLKKLIGPLLGPLIFVVLLFIIRSQDHKSGSEMEGRLKAYSNIDKAAIQGYKVKHKSSATSTPIYSTKSESTLLSKAQTIKPSTVGKKPVVEEVYPDADDVAENLINDTDVIESLASYQFMMRSLADDDQVIHKYIGGKSEHTIYQALCGNKTYDYQALPTASVIISFHQNERLLSILHTLHSIHLNSPTELLKEIILIDDNSKKASHKEAMESYINTHFPPGLIKIHRHPGPDQLGLIKGRLLGIKMATGDVVVCMDAHMELQPRWLEPLLQAIHNERNIMATSHLDWMKPVDEDPSKWTYEHGYHKVKTTWVWKSFNFGFRSIRLKEVNHNRFSTQPIESPMSVGTIWAIDRSFFFEIGAFDDGMVFWGAENVDLPIRIHLCSGGRVVNIPCSKASHQEMRHQRDYRRGWRDRFNINFKRLAEVWLDGEYKQTFDYHNQYLKTVAPGDLTERLELRKRCPRNFSYYMDQAFPEMGVDAISFAWKGVMNLGVRKCFYHSTESGSLKLTKCSKEYSKEQSVFLNIHGQLRQYLSVFNIHKIRYGTNNNYRLKRDDYFYEYFHNSYTKWMHTKDGCIYSPEHSQCLGADGERLLLFPCNGTCTDTHMQWKFRQYTHYFKGLWEGSMKQLAYNRQHGQTEEGVAMFYDAFREYLISRGKPVHQSDIDYSEYNFFKFQAYGME